MGYHAYILQSAYDGTFYYGSCEALEKRVRQHNKGKSRYTKGRRPWRLHFSEVFETRAEARKRERFYKSIEGYRYLKDRGII